MRALLALLALVLLAPAAAAQEPAFDPAEPATWAPAAEAACLGAGEGAWGLVLFADSLVPAWFNREGYDGLGELPEPVCAAAAQTADLGHQMVGAIAGAVVRYVLGVLGA